MRVPFCYFSSWGDLFCIIKQSNLGKMMDQPRGQQQNVLNPLDRHQREIENASLEGN